MDVDGFLEFRIQNSECRTWRKSSKFPILNIFHKIFVFNLGKSEDPSDRSMGEFAVQRNNGRYDFSIRDSLEFNVAPFLAHDTKIVDTD